MSEVKSNNESSINQSIDHQIEVQTLLNIKRLIQGAKSINLSVLDEVILESDNSSMFDISGESAKVSQSLSIVKEFCNAIRNIS